MKKLAEIKNGLDLTTERLSELITMRDGINTNLQTLQDGFVNGKIPSETKRGGDRKSEDAKNQMAESATRFTKETAAKASVSENVIKQELQIANNTTFDEMTAAEARQNLIETARERDLVALEAKRREKEELLSHALEATRQRIIQYRIDHELPPLSPQKLAAMAAETHHRSARA
jgi:uncharacterized protein YkwD